MIFSDRPLPSGRNTLKRLSVSGSFTLSVECRLAASHILPGCPPCDRLHGHTWLIRACWTFSDLDDMGMGANFHVLKEILNREVRERFDHRHLNDVAPFDKKAATAENLSREVFRLLKNAFDPGSAGYLSRVEVWESPETCAIFEESPE